MQYTRNIYMRQDELSNNIFYIQKKIFLTYKYFVNNSKSVERVNKVKLFIIDKTQDSFFSNVIR